MSKYTTGELAKLCGVTVRTVQYYDTRGILIPSELSEGGRRLYTDGDLRRLKIICFLRDMGLPIDAIAQLLEEEEPGRVITLLLEQQAQTLHCEIAQQQAKLEKLLVALVARLPQDTLLGYSKENQKQFKEMYREKR